MYAKYPYDTKHQFLNKQNIINKTESTGLKYFKDHNAFIEFSNDMQDVYKNIGESNIVKKLKILIVFDDMIADMIIKNFIQK